MCMEGEPPDFINEVRVKAKKEHRCDECDRTISAGEEYMRSVGKWDGNLNTYKTCAHCCIGRGLLEKECDTFIFGQIAEDLREHIHEALPWSGKAARLYLGMHRKWRRFSGDGLMPVPPAYVRPFTQGGFS